MARIFIAPAAGTSIRVKEVESGRGFTHLSLIQDPEIANGVTTLVGRRRCLTPWIEGSRLKNGVVVIPNGGTASIEINGVLAFPRVESHRTGYHRGMYHKQGEPAFHHIERGRDKAVTVFSDDLSGGVTMWSE